MEVESESKEVQDFFAFYAFYERKNLLIQALHFRERMRALGEVVVVVDGIGIPILIHKVCLTPIRKDFQEGRSIHFIPTERCSNATLDTWRPRHGLKMMVLINFSS